MITARPRPNMLAGAAAVGLLFWIFGTAASAGDGATGPDRVKPAAAHQSDPKVITPASEAGLVASNAPIGRLMEKYPAAAGSLRWLADRSVLLVGVVGDRDDPKSQAASYVAALVRADLRVQMHFISVPVSRTALDQVVVRIADTYTRWAPAGSALYLVGPDYEKGTVSVGVAAADRAAWQVALAGQDLGGRVVVVVSGPVKAEAQQVTATVVGAPHAG